MFINKFIIFLIFLFSTLTYGEVGVINNTIGTDSVIIRDGSSIPITVKTEIEEGDKIITNNSFVLFLIYPATQITLTKNSEFSIDEHDYDVINNRENSQIVMGFLKGKLKILVDKLKDDDTTEQTIKTNTVALAVRGTEFEIEESNEGTNVDVIEGRVTVSTENDSTELSKDDSIQVNKSFKTRLSERIKRREKYIQHNWEMRFFDREKVREKWRERRAELRKSFEGLSPESRRKMLEEKKSSRELRRKDKNERQNNRNIERRERSEQFKEKPENRNERFKERRKENRKDRSGRD